MQSVRCLAYLADRNVLFALVATGRVHYWALDSAAHGIWTAEPEAPWSEMLVAANNRIVTLSRSGSCMKFWGIHATIADAPSLVQTVNLVHDMSRSPTQFRVQRSTDGTCIVASGIDIARLLVIQLGPRGVSQVVQFSLDAAPRHYVVADYSSGNAGSVTRMRLIGRTSDRVLDMNFRFCPLGEVELSTEGSSASELGHGSDAELPSHRDPAPKWSDDDPDSSATDERQSSRPAAALPPVSEPVHFPAPARDADVNATAMGSGRATADKSTAAAAVGSAFSAAARPIRAPLGPDARRGFAFPSVGPVSGLLLNEMRQEFAAMEERLADRIANSVQQTCSALGLCCWRSPPAAGAREGRMAVCRDIGGPDCAAPGVAAAQMRKIPRESSNSST